MNAHKARLASRSRAGYGIMEYMLLGVITVIALVFGLPVVQDHLTGVWTGAAPRLSSERHISSVKNTQVNQSVTAIRQLKGAKAGTGAGEIPTNLLEVTKQLNANDAATASGENGQALQAALGAPLPTVKGAVSKSYVSSQPIPATGVAKEDSVTIPIGKILE
jgi:hypothetical protein